MCNGRRVQGYRSSVVHKENKEKNVVWEEEEEVKGVI